MFCLLVRKKTLLTLLCLQIMLATILIEGLVNVCSSRLKSTLIYEKSQLNILYGGGIVYVVISNAVIINYETYDKL